MEMRRRSAVLDSLPCAPPGAYWWVIKPKKGVIKMKVNGKKTTPKRLAKEIVEYWAGMADMGYMDDDSFGYLSMTDRQKELVRVQVEKILKRVYKLLK